MQTLRGFWVAGLIAGFALAGCGGGADEGDDEMAPDTVGMEGALEEAVDETGDAVEETGEAIGDGAEETGEAIEEGVEETGDKVEDAADAVD